MSQAIDGKTEILIWILIDAYRRYPGYIDQSTFDAAAERYQRELAKRGVELEIFFNDVNGTSKEVYTAGYTAMEHGLISMQRPGSGRAPIECSIREYLELQRYITADEIRLAKEAAKATHLADRQHTLKDDPVE